MLGFNLCCSASNFLAPFGTFLFVPNGLIQQGRQGRQGMQGRQGRQAGRAGMAGRAGRAGRAHLTS